MSFQDADACLYPNWEGGLSVGTHSFDKDGFCNVCGEYRGGDKVKSEGIFTGATPQDKLYDYKGATYFRSNIVESCGQCGEYTPWFCSELLLALCSKKCADERWEAIRKYAQRTLSDSIDIGLLVLGILDDAE
jgi:hypothetical protein